MAYPTRKNYGDVFHALIRGSSKKSFSELLLIDFNPRGSISEVLVQYEAEIPRRLEKILQRLPWKNCAYPIATYLQLFTLMTKHRGDENWHPERTPYVGKTIAELRTIDPIKPLSVLIMEDLIGKEINHYGRVYTKEVSRKLDVLPASIAIFWELTGDDVFDLVELDLDLSVFFYRAFQKSREVRQLDFDKYGIIQEEFIGQLIDLRDFIEYYLPMFEREPGIPFPADLSEYEEEFSLAAYTDREIEEELLRPGFLQESSLSCRRKVLIDILEEWELGVTRDYASMRSDYLKFTIDVNLPGYLEALKSNVAEFWYGDGYDIIKKMSRTLTAADFQENEEADDIKILTVAGYLRQIKKLKEEYDSYYHQLVDILNSTNALPDVINREIARNLM